MDEIKEASAPLQDLHERVIRCLERREVRLPQRNIWSYDGSSSDRYVDDIREQLILVLAGQTELRSTYGADLPKQLKRTIESLDELSSCSEPVLDVVEEIAKQHAAIVGETVGALAAVRVGMPDLMGLLALIVPASATATISDDKLLTLLAYRLKRVGVPSEYITDLVGGFDDIPPESDETLQLDMQDTRIGTVERRLSRFERGGSSPFRGACNRLEKSETFAGELTAAVRELQEAVARYERRCMNQPSRVAAVGGSVAADDYLESIRDQLALLQKSLRERSVLTEWCALAIATVGEIDQLLSKLEPMLKLVDHCVCAKFRPGSRFEPPHLRDIQRRAPSVHALVARIAELRLRLTNAAHCLVGIVPSSTIASDQLPVVFAYNLRRVGVLARVIADAIGRLDHMHNDQLHDADRVHEREEQARALRRQLRRLAATLRGRCTTANF